VYEASFATPQRRDDPLPSTPDDSGDVGALRASAERDAGAYCKGGFWASFDALTSSQIGSTLPVPARFGFRKQRARKSAIGLDGDSLTIREIKF
jgi:hypothetical protein